MSASLIGRLGSSAFYHIETGVSVSQVFSKLTAEKFDPALLKERVPAARMRRTLGFFIERKFEPQEITDKLKVYGFNKGKYTKVVVTWDATPEAKAAAAKAGIEIWDFQDIMRKINETIRGKRSYFTDDTLRTIGLFARATSGVDPGPEIEAVTRKPKVDRRRHVVFRRCTD